MRICLYGGPGSGKSTTASRLFHDLKVSGQSVELVHEYIKKWAYQKRVPKSFDQVYIFGQQIHAEDLVIQSGIKHLVTDSPLAMQSYYGWAYDLKFWPEILKLALQYDSVHPSVNIFLDREGIPYQQIGRYETASEALNRDTDMKGFLEREGGLSFSMFRTNDYAAILEFVQKQLEAEQCLAR